MLHSVNNAYRNEMQLNGSLVMNTSNLIIYVWNGTYVNICMCAYGEMLVPHMIGWNRQEESVKNIAHNFKSVNAHM